MNYKVGDKRYSKSAEDIGIILDITDSYVYVKYPKFLNRTAYKKENFEKLTIPLFPGYFKNKAGEKIVLFTDETTGTVVDPGSGETPKGHTLDCWTSCLNKSVWEYLPDYKEKESEMTKLSQIAKILIDNKADQHWLDEASIYVKSDSDKTHFSSMLFFDWASSEQGYDYWCSIFSRVTSKKLEKFKFSFAEMEYEINKQLNKDKLPKCEYKLLKRDPKVGDIVFAFDRNYTQNLPEIAVVTKAAAGIQVNDIDYWFTTSRFNVIETKPGTDVIDGDDVIALATKSDSRAKGEIFKNVLITALGYIAYKKGYASKVYDEFLVLVKNSPTQTTIEEVVEEIKEQPKKKGAARLEKEPKAQSTKKDTFMSKIKSNLTTAVAQNKEALIVAAKLEAGNVLNKTIISKITPKLPFLLQGFAKHPAAEIVLANVAAMAIRQFAEGNEKLNKMADLMVGAAAVNTLSQFNIQEMVEDLLKDIKLPAGVLDADDK